MKGSPYYRGYSKNSLQEEFEAKNEILWSKFLGLSSQEYFDEMFPDKKEEDEIIIVLGTLKDKEGNIIEKGTVTRIKAENIWDIAWRSNAYIPYCDFKRNYYHSKTLEKVRAFVIDCDGVTSSRLKKVLKYLWTTLPAEPTHIVNSGKGVHFVYLLSRPIKVSGLRWSINSLNKAIQERFSTILQVDKHPVVHPYRFPGFMTKINTVAVGFKIREPYGFEELMKLFEIKPKKGKPARGKKESSKKKAEILVLPNGRRAFFEWVLRRLFFNPPIPGRRQNSFFALGIVSYKCRREVPYEEAVETIPMIYEDMMDRNLHIGFDIEEAYEAFHKGYNPKYVRASWKYLCSLFGWEYKANKRNGKSRKEHLEFARQVKRLRMESRWKELEEHIKRLVDKGLTKREIAKEVGIHYTTLYRRFKYLF